MCAELRWAEHYFHTTEAIITFIWLFLLFLMTSGLENFFLLSGTILTLELVVHIGHKCPILADVIDSEHACYHMRLILNHFVPLICPAVRVWMLEKYYELLYTLCEGYITDAWSLRRISTPVTHLYHNLPQLGFINITTSQWWKSTQFNDKFYFWIFAHWGRTKMVSVPPPQNLL